MTHRSHVWHYHVLDMSEEEKNKTISGVSTLLLFVVAIVVCSFVGLMPPDPPIAEEGVEVNLGNSETGLGTAEQPDVSASRVPPTPAGSAGRQIAHQNTEPTEQVDAADNSKVTSNQTVVPSDAKAETNQPRINQNALFRKRDQSTGGSEGVTQGTGNQGKTGGDPNSTRYDGNPGNGGSGWSLEGRGLRGRKPQISYNSNEQGTNVVKIWVDRNGNVVRAEPSQKGSTVIKPYFAQKAKEAALQFHFTPKSDAPELQVGYVTCRFSNV